MAGVPGVLLDHVDEHIADAHGALAERAEPPIGRSDLRLPRGERGAYGSIVTGTPYGGIRLLVR